MIECRDDGWNLVIRFLVWGEIEFSWLGVRENKGNWDLGSGSE